MDLKECREKLKRGKKRASKNLENWEWAEKARRVGGTWKIQRKIGTRKILERSGEEERVKKSRGAHALLT